MFWLGLYKFYAAGNKSIGKSSRGCLLAVFGFGAASIYAKSAEQLPFPLLEICTVRLVEAFFYNLISLHPIIPQKTINHRYNLLQVFRSEMLRVCQFGKDSVIKLTFFAIGLPSS